MLGGLVAYEPLATCSVQSTTQLRKAQKMVLYDKKEIVRHSVSKSFPSERENWLSTGQSRGNRYYRMCPAKQSRRLNCFPEEVSTIYESDFVADHVITARTLLQIRKYFLSRDPFLCLRIVIFSN